MFSYSRVECCPFRLQVCRQCTTSKILWGGGGKKNYIQKDFLLFILYNTAAATLRAVSQFRVALSLSLSRLLVFCTNSIMCSSIVVVTTALALSYSFFWLCIVMSFVMFSFCLSSVFLPSPIYLFLQIETRVFHLLYSAIPPVRYTWWHNAQQQYIHLSGRLLLPICSSLTERCCAFH